jgi:hypothetical protein
MEYVAPLLVAGIPVVGILLLVFWICQFISLMLLSDADFPGRHDKVLWAAAFLLLFVVAAFAFYYWKMAYRSMRQAEKTSH